MKSTSNTHTQNTATTSSSINSTIIGPPTPHDNKNKLLSSETDHKVAKEKATIKKLQMLNIMKAMRKRKMPHNTQVNKLLNKLINSQRIVERENLLSQGGKVLLNDFRDLLKTLQKTLNVKNKDELIQSFFYHCHCMESPDPNVTGNCVMIQERKKASEALFRMCKLVLLNNKFRALLNEIIDLPHDIFNSAASQVGESLTQAGSSQQETKTKTEINTRNTALMEDIPKNKQDELLHRIQAAAAQMQKHPEYQDAFKTLIQLFETWTSHLTQPKQIDPARQDYREKAEREVKAIIETWAQGQSIDFVLHGVRRIMRDVNKDKNIREFYHAFMNYIVILVTEPGFAGSDRSTQEGEYLMNRANEIVKGRYRKHLCALFINAHKFMNLMAEDEISKEINDRIATIHHNLWRDSEGNPAFKPHLLNDVRMTLLPAFAAEIEYIPICHIEYENPEYLIAIEDLVISADSLLTIIFDTKIECVNSVSLKNKNGPQHSQQSLCIRMTEIQGEINDAVFYYKKKFKMFDFSDRGLASLRVGRKGITVSLSIHSVTDNPAKTFEVTCKCNADNLDVKIHNSKHDTLYKAIHPFFISVIRKQVAKAIESKLTDMLNKVDQKLIKALVEMHQNLQNEADATDVSQDRSHSGFFSNIAMILNHNMKNKVQKRNEVERMEPMPMSQGGSSFIDSKTEIEEGEPGSSNGQQQLESTSN